MSQYPTIGTQFGILDIMIKQGDTSSIVLSFKDDFNDPISLVGYTIKMDVKINQDVDEDPVLSKTLTKGLSVAGHVLTIDFGVETLDLGLDTYFYDILFSTAGKNQRWISGKLLIDKSVTK